MKSEIGQGVLKIYDLKGNVCSEPMKDIIILDMFKNNGGFEFCK